MTHIAAPPPSASPLDEALKLVKSGDPVVFDRDGQPLAALISVEDLGLLQRLIEEEEDRIDNALADAALKEPGPDIPWEQIKRDAGF